ncbi:MAG: hypothetical protein RJB11_3373, partial [Planctomycetota bacterium]
IRFREMLDIDRESLSRNACHGLEVSLRFFEIRFLKFVFLKLREFLADGLFLKLIAR